MPVGKKDSSTAVAVSAGTGDSAARQHTPGPWRIATTGNIGNIIEANSGKRLYDGDTGMRAVATFQSCCASGGYLDQEANQLANGRLIAAAPDLLAALREVYTQIHNLPRSKTADHIAMVVAVALSKAEA